jgi:hypothetical protein
MTESLYDPDELMSERLERVEDGKIKCPVNKVDMTGDDVISVVVDTPSGVVSCDYIVPEIPTGDTEIVQVCRYYGVDPAKPSRLEDKMIEWDGSEIYFETVLAPTEKIKSMFSLDDEISKDSFVWTAFFFGFFPVTGLTERMYTSHDERPMMRDGIIDYLFGIVMWFAVLIAAILVFGILGSLLLQIV